MKQQPNTQDETVSPITWLLAWLWRSATTMAGEEVSTGLAGGSCLLVAGGLLWLQPCAWAAGADGLAAAASGWASVKVTDRFCSTEGYRAQKIEC